MKKPITIIGAGLAGSEAAWQVAERGQKVDLYEMRPLRETAAHKSNLCAELVCSNSLGSNLEGSAPFLLKEELRNLNSLVIQTADKHAVPAGAALAVNRGLFAREITEKLESHPNINLIRREMYQIPTTRPLIFATGPLTSDRLSDAIFRLIGEDYLYFYDALSPIVDAESIDYSKVFFASRYGKGADDYLNCPMTVNNYRCFVNELLKAKKVVFKSFEKGFYEKPVYFEGCMPIEELARRGEKTLAFGPLKPVGLEHPDSGERFHAVLQLRKENKEATAFNLVGCQTKLTYSEQKLIFQMVPGLEKAEFFRYGAIHRNTYINSPQLLNPDLTLKGSSELFFAGQIVGVEGYMESCAMGFLAGVGAVKKILNEPFELPPSEMAMGALLKYVTETKTGKFQPMNTNFGLFGGEAVKIRDKKSRNSKIIERALKAQEYWIRVLDIRFPADFHSG